MLFLFDSKSKNLFGFCRWVHLLLIHTSDLKIMFFFAKSETADFKQNCDIQEATDLIFLSKTSKVRIKFK